MKIIVLGCSGMIGSTMLRILSAQSEWKLIGVVRATFPPENSLREEIQWICGVDLTSQDALTKIFYEAQPDVVVNCAGLTKHSPYGNEAIPALVMNALLPQRLSELCKISNARLIHISTDCVFSGILGNYREIDHPDAIDVYGRTKSLGEVMTHNSITLRTSTIGHELVTRQGLLEWFLSQEHCKGYYNAIFSGLPTVEFARIVRDLVIPNPDLHGLYHVGAQAINKELLLRLIAQVYEKKVFIEADGDLVIDRSLNTSKFERDTGYRAPDWSDLIEMMHQDIIEENKRNV